MPPRKTEPPRLSELESAVLGVFWRRGPCSAYVVQKNFQPISAGWSASPGALYPLIRRLEHLGLIAPKETERRGKRTIRTYALTAAGRAALERWVLSPPEWAALPSADPIRTRTFFLDVLPRAERRAFLVEAERRTSEALAAFEGESAEMDEHGLEYLARLGGTYALKARRRWLRAIRERVAAAKGD
jgi:DNA-binding PadR family transcriptional regulator